MIEAGKAGKTTKGDRDNQTKTANTQTKHAAHDKRTAAATLYAPARAVKRGAMYPSPRTPGSRSSPPKDAPASMPEQSSEPWRSGTARPAARVRRCRSCAGRKERQRRAAVMTGATAPAGALTDKRATTVQVCVCVCFKLKPS